MYESLHVSLLRSPIAIVYRADENKLTNINLLFNWAGTERTWPETILANMRAKTHTFLMLRIYIECCYLCQMVNYASKLDQIKPRHKSVFILFINTT